MTKIQWIRAVGYSMIGLAVLLVAIKLPADAWLSGADPGKFDRYVGWANIFALPVAAIALLITIFDRLAKRRQNLAVDDAVEKLAARASRNYKRSLAQLLAIEDVPGSRSIRIDIVEAKSSRQGDLQQVVVADLAAEVIKGRAACLAVQGPPGSGKSVLAVEVAQVLNEMRASTKQIAVVVSLSSWNPYRMSVEPWLLSQITTHLSIDKKLAQELFDDQRVILILDGLDEMDSEGSKGAARIAIDLLDAYIAQTPEVRILITSRSGGSYVRTLRRLSSVRTMTIAPLSDDAIVEFIQTRLVDATEKADWRKVLESVGTANGVADVLRTPWSLTSALAFYKAGGDPQELLPCTLGPSKKETRRKYHERVRQLLVSNFVISRVWVGSGGGRRFEKGIRSLTVLARLIALRKEVGGNVPEVSLPHWWSVLDEERVRKTHGWTTFIVLHYPWGIVGLFPFSDVPEGGLSGWWLMGAISANQLAIYLFSMMGAVKDRTPSRVSFNIFVNIRRLGWTTGGLVVTILALVWGGFIYLAPFYFTYSLLSVLVFTFVVFLLISTTPAFSGIAISPVDIIKGDRNATLLAASSYGFLAGLYFDQLYGLTIGFVFGSMVFLGRFFSSSYARYLVAVSWGAVVRKTPLRFNAFLSWAWNLGIMRSTTSGYRFRHAEIEEYLIKPVSVR